MITPTCPNCGTRIKANVYVTLESLSAAEREAGPHPQPGASPLAKAVPTIQAWLDTLQEGWYLTGELHRSYLSTPGAVVLGSPQLARILGQLGCRKRRTNQGRYWYIPGPGAGS